MARRCCAFSCRAFSLASGRRLGRFIDCLIGKSEPVSKAFIRIGGAREHNLKNLTLDIPRDKLVVITGLSGSGKSSLAFDTIYAEGQRKYVESLSAYARQFLDQMQKPDVDYIEGLSPAIAIEQRSSGSSPRSIIATTTEIYDYLRLLYAHVGQPYCPETGVPIVRQTTSDIVDRIMALPAHAGDAAGPGCPRRKRMKLNFPSSSKCHSYIFYTPKTEDGMHVTQLPFEFKVSFIHVLHPENSRRNG